MTTFYAVGSGELYHYSAVSWDDVHNAANCFAAYDGAIGVYTDGPGGFWYCSRGGISFDVTVVSVGSASILLYCTLLDTSDGDFDVILVSGADLADTLVVADYGELLDEVTSFGSINSADLVLNAWNAIPLNAVGLAALNASLASGKFRVGVRHSKDLNDTEPTFPGSYAYFSGYDDATYKPQIIVNVSDIISTIWQEGTKIHIIDENGVEQSSEGALVAAGSNPEGALWMELTKFHNIDEEGDERSQEGTATGDTSDPGYVHIEGAHLHGIDESGDERYL